MTRKDYIKIANAVRVNVNVNDNHKQRRAVMAALRDVADDIAAELRRDNERFRQNPVYGSLRLLIPS